MDFASISEDIDELKALECQASRPTVKLFLNKEIQRLQSSLTASQQQNGSLPSGSSESAGDRPPVDSVVVQRPSAGTSVSSVLPTIKIQTYGVRLVVKNLTGKNYEWEINNLLYEILPDQSYHKLKSDMVLLMLRKKDSKHWECVTFQEQKLKEKKTPKFDDKEDPQVGLMKMMKQMYDEGDDDMKRTIKKAWVESQEKKMQAGGDAFGMGDL